MAGSNSITGITSGLDTNAIIDAIIKSERTNATLLESEEAQKKTVITAYQSLQAKVLGLSTSLAALTSAGNFNKSTINISNPDALAASSTGRVGTGTYDLQVLALARNDQLASQGFEASDTALFGTGNIQIKVGDGSLRTITIDSSNNTLQGIRDAINKSSADVTASIVNDGSSSHPYRLVIAANKTGAANKIDISSNLTGGQNLNYSTATFDTPEQISVDSSTSSKMTLGMSAAFTGNQNKTYTFTVAGTGAQTVGSDNIVLNWTDGTNSGSVVVTQADSEVELVGDGSDGLTLNFSAGTLTEGDTFQVATFAPLLQKASDAKISLGSNGGEGSPITVTSQTNDFKDVVGGLTLTAKQVTDPGTSIHMTTDVDVKSIETNIKSFIDAYNQLSKYIDDQNKYSEGDTSAPTLFGDMTVWTIQNSLQSALGSIVPGITTKFNQLYSIGIRTTGSGVVSITDSSRLEDAIRNNPDEVVKLFTNSGNSSNNGIEYLSSTTATKISTALNVNITQAATKGGFTGSSFVSPATNPITLTDTTDTLKLKVDGLISDEIVLTPKTYQTPDELVSEIQTRINADEKIGTRGVKVEWVDDGNGNGHLSFNSASYGSTSKIELDNSIGNSAYSSLGLSTGTAVVGKDVAGTINGEEATGRGQILSGKDGNKTTEGLKLKVILTSDQLLDGNEGTVTVVQGIASRLAQKVDEISKSGDGLIDRRIASYQKQIDDMAKQVSDIDARLAIRRQTLEAQFSQMETTLSQLQSQGSYLTSQLAGLNTNWGG
jgi:flagellar hook-associated protein 2